MRREPLVVDEDEALISKRQVTNLIGCCPRKDTFEEDKNQSTAAAVMRVIDLLPT